MRHWRCLAGHAPDWRFKSIEPAVVEQFCSRCGVIEGERALPRLKKSEVECWACHKTVRAWRTYADGRQVCVPCASKGR